MPSNVIHAANSTWKSINRLKCFKKTVINRVNKWFRWFIGPTNHKYYTLHVAFKMLYLICHKSTCSRCVSLRIWITPLLCLNVLVSAKPNTGILDFIHTTFQPKWFHKWCNKTEHIITIYVGSAAHIACCLNTKNINWIIDHKCGIIVANVDPQPNQYDFLFMRLTIIFSLRNSNCCQYLVFLLLCKYSLSNKFPWFISKYSKLFRQIATRNVFVYFMQHFSHLKWSSSVFRFNFMGKFISIPWQMLIVS